MKTKKEITEKENEITEKENEITNEEIELKKYKKDKTDIYPFINEMVDTFYNDNCNELINNSISGG